ncbi:flagellar motor protein MotD [Dasania sp. GY-MA-18]|uniref:Flagellar motor protein MotD n=1 Tax=Dasania phycosphaerae TaxID=2950436 RepID=A0A9J6RJG2_9GAMM|nr:MULTISPECIES: flagellar motor protein MotD [Dasania]MCR8921681.1 flagellar motor protein MotD [Dasania sp. GY-MA-18]MCZ0864109.1 flagellar motor protein MotD [Dasania phycosphaerae]MCZ0867837.1 flagellar motor protein MotD [Dasania phycosphaerae]
MRRQVVDDNVHHERWLVSYADFITLLFAFFVVMYSISQVSETKYRVLSNTLTKTFNKKDAQLTLDPIQMGEPALKNNINLIDLEAMALKNSDGEAEGEGGADDEGELPEQFHKITENIEEVFGELLDTKMIHLQGNEEWLSVEMKSSLLFETGDARLTVPSMEILASLAGLFKDSSNPIRVEGFTDNVPISNEFFESNWELSAARAAAVVRLFAEEGIDPARMAAVGYGEHQPVADNDSPAGREKNRRVVLMISKTAQLRPVLPELAGDSDFKAPEPEPEPVPAVPDDPLQGVQTIKLEGGGLLFTRDTEPAEQP